MPRMPICDIYMYICMYVPHAHNPESVQKILWTRYKKRNGRLEKLSIYMLGSSMMKKTAIDLKVKGMKLGSTRGLLGYSCQEKDARVSFRQKSFKHFCLFVCLFCCFSS